MKLLQSKDVLGAEAFSYSEESGGKLGLPDHVGNQCPKIANKIVNGTYLPWGEINRENILRILNTIREPEVLLRSTHPDDSVGYIGRLPTQTVYPSSILDDVPTFFDSPEFFFGDSEKQLKKYIKRLGYRGVRENGISVVGNIGRLNTNTVDVNIKSDGKNARIELL